MMKQLLIAFAWLFVASSAAFGQGTLEGKVIDKKTKEPIAFATVSVSAGGSVVNGAYSDDDGKFRIKPLDPGKYDITVSFVGYNTIVVKDFVIRADKIESYTFEVESEATVLTGVEVFDYKVPLIDKDKTVSGATVTKDEIAKMASRSANAVVATVGGVHANTDGTFNMRGQRSDGTVTYIDGIKVRGASALPESAIEQVAVILGGTPAQYGDATGGIISITTRGPSRQFGGGVELETSEFLDPYKHNRASFNLQGPLFWDKEKKNSLLGFFIASDFNLDNSDVLPLKSFYANDSLLHVLETNPLRYSLNQGYRLQAEYARASDLDQSKYTYNTHHLTNSTTAKIDVKAGKNVNLSFGGTFNYSDNTNFSRYNSMFNYNTNANTINNTWRVFGRFTQRFPQDKESTSLVKNVYYTVQADYTKVYNKTQDQKHKENLFNYGYVGKFDTYKAIQFDTTRTMEAVYDYYIGFTPSDLNPVWTNYTKSYYNLYDSATGMYSNRDIIRFGGGLFNSQTPNGAYGGVYSGPDGSLWSLPGNPQSIYQIVDQTQFTVNVNGSADIGNHEIKLGFVYEQSTSSSYGYAAASFWTTMYNYANAHIAELDLESGHIITQNNTDYTVYYRKYDGASQYYFDKNLRKLLGLAVDGTDWIDIDSYDPVANTMSYYDKDYVWHQNVKLNGKLSVDMFSPDELINNGLAAARGYDYYGNKLKSKPSLDDYFTNQENGNYLRSVAPYQPIYMAGYIQDKFSFDDIVVTVGLRIDRFDANQPVLKDPYTLYPARTVADVLSNSELSNYWNEIPSNMGNDYVVYVSDKSDKPSVITGFRSGNTWFDRAGNVVSDPEKSGLDAGNGVIPFLVQPGNDVLNSKSFEDYQPQISLMPRIAFSFPISDEALFYAHYDVLTQRPKSFNVFDPQDYLFLSTGKFTGSDAIPNPNLKPEKTIDYELGYQQRLSNTSSLNISAFYREMRNMVQNYRYTAAYPRTYYSFNNIDFGTVKGLTLSFDLRRTSNLRMRAQYTLQFANGTGSNSDDGIAGALIRSGQPNLRTLIPLNFDQRHAFSANVDFRYGEGNDYNGPMVGDKQILKNFGVNITANAGSGTPYTRRTKPGGGGLIVGSVNGSSMPWTYTFDGRIDKDFIIASGKDRNGQPKMYSINVYFQILNILNTLNVTNVYAATGNPDDDGYLVSPEYQDLINSQTSAASYRDLYAIYIDNPYNYAAPRRIRVGLSLNF